MEIFKNKRHHSRNWFIKKKFNVQRFIDWKVGCDIDYCIDYNSDYFVHYLADYVECIVDYWADFVGYIVDYLDGYIDCFVDSKDDCIGYSIDYLFDYLNDSFGGYIAHYIECNVDI